MDPTIERWNETYRDPAPFPEPNPHLAQFRSFLPSGGTALDLACGRGADALYLADCGFQVTAWDGSEVALTLLKEEANRRALSITTLCAPITVDAFKDHRFDLIYVHRFLDRALFPVILEALQPQGRLFYETFTTESLETTTAPQGPKNPSYRLEANELVRLCAPLHIRLFIDGLMPSRDAKTFIPISKSLLIGEKRSR